MKKQNAFSLGELIITLGVISFLFLVAIPLFKEAKPDKNIYLIRRACNIVYSTVHDLINDSFLYPDYDLGFAYIPEGKTKDYTIQYFCDNFSNKINTTEYSYNSENKQCTLKTPDGIEWIIKPEFYDGYGNLINDEYTDDGVYASSFYVKIPNKNFYIYMKYDGKLNINDDEVREILADPSKK